jgi:hypothetical protein
MSQTGETEDAIVVVASIIVVMKGHCECGKKNETYAEKSQTIAHSEL